MAYLLGVPYNGNGRPSEESKRFAQAERTTLEGLAVKHQGISSFADPLHPNFTFEAGKFLLSFRRALVEKTRQDELHYHRIDPAINV
jgi:hypothetical protein